MSRTPYAEVVAGVRATIGAHTQAQDAGRTDEIVALYAPDAVLEVPGTEPIEGSVAIHQAFKGWEPTKPQLHLVSNTVVTSSGEGEATAVSDVVFLQRGESSWDVQITGRYVDSLRRHDGEWQFTRRATTYQI
ncbi:nuclear transport factor 2 family protein [Streptomyces sp. NBC_01239]|uniref:nuclear transport factor 2 family protein n=1 Tax=Streptomyces sp. NBC_01239 TaxID=2903792 RepID=UPI002254BD12|nr:nuclear transport factor 2 family protein [Streptomyces sp. NBC_01239]MCX4815182.1 nuclear transport factor 2 family protein [Streptomyces sp. NBC_01239]